MVQIKYCFVILAICCLETVIAQAFPSRCTPKTWGSAVGEPHLSQMSYIPAGRIDITLYIPPGAPICSNYQQTSVGQTVTVCDWDVEPTVDYVNNDPTMVKVHRNGAALLDATAQTTYYCL